MADNETARQAVQAALRGIEVPGGGSLADFAGLSEIIVTPKAVAFAITVDSGMQTAFAPVREAAVKAVEEAAPGRKPLVTLTTGSATASQDEPASSGSPVGGRRPPPPKEPVAGIAHIVAVASGKGGVGKSTTAANLALAFAAAGKRVGLLDADVYGPSMPKLMGLEGKPAVREDGVFAPHEAYGLKVMSIGSMLESDSQAVVWRGPMASAALRQLLRETDWGELDLLVVDLPPGTGDVHISICQQSPLSGAVIVSTPQDLALVDARKAVDMFGRMHVPVLGVVENMSYFVAPDTGHRYEIFGHGGAEAAAAEMAVPFLGGVPLDMVIREGSDAGKPAVAVSPESPQAQAYLAIAGRILDHAALK